MQGQMLLFSLRRDCPTQRRKCHWRGEPETHEHVQAKPNGDQFSDGGCRICYAARNKHRGSVNGADRSWRWNQPPLFA
jgi:hypothetical protein